MRGKIPEGEVRGAIVETLHGYGLDGIGLCRSVIWLLAYGFWVHNTTVSVSASISVLKPETQSEIPELGSFPFAEFVLFCSCYRKLRSRLRSSQTLNLDLLNSSQILLPLSYWSSCIVAKNRWYISIDTVWFLGWISTVHSEMGGCTTKKQTKKNKIVITFKSCMHIVCTLYPCS